MNPYEVLGVTPSASMPEIEARYRLLLREYHPDLHHHEGAEAVAFAEAATRSLNSAMEQLRRDQGGGGLGRTATGGWGDPSSHGGRGPNAGRRSESQWPGQNPFWRPPSDDAGPGDASTRGADFDSARRSDWFGDPVTHPPDEPVPCPFCGRPFQRLDQYEYHLEQTHSYRRVAPRPPRTRSRVVRILGMFRFIPLWLLVPIAFANWKMFGFQWFTITLALVLLVLWTQTSRLFRD